MIFRRISLKLFVSKIAAAGGTQEWLAETYFFS